MLTLVSLALMLAEGAAHISSTSSLVALIFPAGYAGPATVPRDISPHSRTHPQTTIITTLTDTT